MLCSGLIGDNAAGWLDIDMTTKDSNPNPNLMLVVFDDESTSWPAIWDGKDLKSCADAVRYNVRIGIVFACCPCYFLTRFQ